MNSALVLKSSSGYLGAPTSHRYFSSLAFSVTVWINPQALTSFEYATIIDFGNGFGADNVKLLLDSNNKPTFLIYTGASLMLKLISSQELALNQWQFLACTFDSVTQSAHIYVNSIQTAGSSSNVVLSCLPLINRTINLVGRGMNGFLDDLRFYNTSLNHSQVNEIMQSDDSTLDSGCQQPLVRLEQRYPHPDQPLTLKRNSMLTLVSLVEMRCRLNSVNVKEWLVFRVDSASSNQSRLHLNSDVNPSVNFASLVLPTNTLEYGLYRFVFKVSVANFESISCQIDTYVRVVPSGLVISALGVKSYGTHGGGTIEITRGVNQDIQFNPFINSYDLDSVVTMTSLKFNYLYQIIKNGIQQGYSSLTLTNSSNCFFKG